MARYWTADLHLGHVKVSEIRGFASTDEHDDHILAQLHRIHPGDDVWILGDISSGRREGSDRALKLLRDVPARLHLIAGNHDAVSSIHRNGWKKQREWLEVFESVQQFGRIRVGGADVLMSHYPYAALGDGPNREGPGRYMEYRLPDVGLPLVHGHTHQSAPQWTGPPCGVQQRMYCVSWDASRDLVPESRLNSWQGAISTSV